jgi:hypothetical protein
MRLIIDIPEYLVSEARKRIQEGRYSDLSSFIVTSVENQLMLDKGDLVSSTVLLEGSQGLGSPLESLPNNRKLPGPSDYPAAQIVAYPEWEDRSEKHWLWGQINKLLPIKFAARALANETLTTKELPLLEAFANKAAAEARVVGLSLKRLDQAEKRPPGYKLGTGFPTSGKIEKAERRFRSQFIAYVRDDRQVSGALPELMFANVIERRGENVMGLTEAGVAFATLSNPVLDKGDWSQALSEEEADFYLDHIRRRVPWEVSAFALILSIIGEGIDGRMEVNNAVRDRLQVEWTPKEVNTQRAGAMARMFDLRLLARERRGRRVRYAATDRGAAWLEQTKRTMGKA